MLRSEFNSRPDGEPRKGRSVPLIDQNAIPIELRSRNQWVVWRRRHRDGKSTKVPYQSLSPREPAESNNEDTWSSFADALITCNDPQHGLEGIGYMFSAEDPFCGIDLDKCVSPSGHIDDWAREILDQLPTYAEISPSGSGLKLFLCATVPGGKGRKKQKLGPDGTGAIECYDRLRYFTVTGRVLDPKHSRMVDVQTELDQLHAVWFPPPIAEDERPRQAPQLPPLLDDRQVFDKATQAQNGAKFTALWNGLITGYPSKSEADCALCSLLSFYTQDPAAIERLFNCSGLVSDKWTKRPDYRESTIAKALERDETYSSGQDNTTTTTRGVENTKNSKNSGGGPNSQYSKYSPSYKEVTSACAREGSAGDGGPDWSLPRLEATEPAAIFPLTALPRPLADLVVACGESLGCPVDFPAVAALAVASGAMGRSIGLKIKDGWIEVPALYCALVGDPGMTKSPAVSLISQPLWKITQEQLAAHRRDLAVQRKAKDKDADPIFPRRIVVDDATVEALAGLLQENPRGLIMVRDELSALFSGLNQYKSGGKGSDRQFFLSAWSGSSAAVDRKHAADRMPIHITHPFLSIVGGITPGMLSEMGEQKNRDDGFLDRMLFTCPEPIPVRWTDHGVSPDLALDWENAIRRLWSVGLVPAVDGKLRPRFVRFTPDALAYFAAWYDQHNLESEGEDFPSHLKGPWSKMRAYCGRLALLIDGLARAFDPGDCREPCDVGVDSLNRAVVLMAYFKSQTRRVRSLMDGTFGECPNARVLLKWVRHAQKSPFNVAEVRNNFRKRFPHEGTQLETALQWLVNRHCIRPYTRPPRSGAGRPKSPEFEVNPALLGDMDGDS